MLHHVSNNVVSTADLECLLSGTVDQAACSGCSSCGQMLDAAMESSLSYVHQGVDPKL